MGSNDSVRGKCVWWRESPNAEDLHDLDVKAPAKRIDCSCFVEGFRWEFRTDEIPKDCPRSRECRYFVSGR